LNAAAFYYDFEDLQLSSYSVSAGAPIGSLRFQNAGKVELHGFEVDLLFRPVANAEFNLGYGDTDSKIKSDNLAQDVANGTNISLDGNELPFSNPSSMSEPGITSRWAAMEPFLCRRTTTGWTITTSQRKTP